MGPRAASQLKPLVHSASLTALAESGEATCSDFPLRRKPGRYRVWPLWQLVHALHK